MKLDSKGYTMIKQHEGLRLKPYLCSAKVPTIGFGNTQYENGLKVTLLDPAITLPRANELFMFYVDRFASQVFKLIKKTVTQNQFNALVSLAYNIGIGAFEKSTLLKLVNENPNNELIRNEFMKWNKANKKVIVGLTNRRKVESDLYFTK